MTKTAKLLASCLGASVIAACFLFALIPKPAQAMGLSPPVLEAPNMMKGVTQQFETSLSRTNEPIDEDMYFLVSVRSDYPEHFSVPESVTIPAGETRVDVEFEVTPVNAANGDYSGLVSFQKQASATEAKGAGAGSIVVQSMSLKLSYTVGGEEVISYEIHRVDGIDSEEGMSNEFKALVSNTGNVQWRPDYIEITIEDTSDTSNVYAETVDGMLFDALDPGEQEVERRIPLTSSLIEGRYTLSADFYDAQGKVTTAESQVFYVFAEGSSKQAGELLSATTKKDSYAAGSKVKVETAFENQGEVQVDAHLVLEIFKDDEYVDLVRGDEYKVDSYETVELSEMIELPDDGEYTISAYVAFGSKKTSSKDIVLSVGSVQGATATTGEVVDESDDEEASGATGATGAFPWIIVLGVILGILIIVLAVVLLLKRKSNQEPPTTPMGGDMSGIGGGYDIPQTDGMDTGAQEDSGAIEF